MSNAQAIAVVHNAPQNALGAASRDRAEESAEAQELDDHGIEVEEEQPEKPNPKREDDEEQRGQPGREMRRKEMRKKKVMDQSTS